MEPSIPSVPNETLINMMADLEEEKVIALVKERIARGDNPFTIVDDCREGLRIVGERYERKEYYLAGLIMAGDIFQEVMLQLDQIITEKYSGNELGTILLGTVAGDIHNIGKNILSMLLTSYGFTVFDLGVDVPPEEFVRQAKEIQPNAIGLSGLITSSFETMKETIRLLRVNSDEKIHNLPIVVGGGMMSEDVCKYVGADYWGNDVMQGVRIFKDLLDVS